MRAAVWKPGGVWVRAVLRGVGRGHRDGYVLAPLWVHGKRGFLTPKACQLTRLKNVGKLRQRENDCPGHVPDCIFPEPLLSTLSHRLPCLFLFWDSSLIHTHTFPIAHVKQSGRETSKSFPQLRQVWVNNFLENMRSSMPVKIPRLDLLLVCSWGWVSNVFKFLKMRTDA